MALQIVDEDLPDAKNLQILDEDSAPTPVAPGVKPVEQIRAQQTGGVNPKLTTTLPMSEIGDRAMGLGQAGLNALVGAVAYPLSGVVGAKDVAMNIIGGDSVDEALAKGGQSVKDVQQSAGSIVPQNQHAQALQAGMAKPFQMASDVMGKGGGAAAQALVGGPNAKAAGEAAGEAWTEAMGAMLGIKGMLAARAAAGVKPKLTQPQSAIETAVSNGFTPPPVEANPRTMNKVGTAIANADKLNDEIAGKNSSVMTDHVKEDLGIPKDQFLNQETLGKLKAEHEKPYAAIQAITDVDLTPDAELHNYFDQVEHPTKGSREAAASDPYFYKNPDFQLIKSGILQPEAPWTPAGALHHIANLRAQASKLFKKAGAAPEDYTRAGAMRGAADALEDFLSRKLQESYHVGGEATGAGLRGPQAVLQGPQAAPALQGPRNAVGPRVAPQQPPAGGPTPMSMGQNPAKHGGTLNPVDNSARVKLVQDFEKARQQLAKIHNVEDSTNLETGRVDPAKLKRLQDNGVALSGGLAKIVQAHRAMGHVVKNVEHGSQNSIRASDVSMGHAAISGASVVPAAMMGHPMVGAVSGAMALLTPMVARKIMASNAYKAFMSKPSAGTLAQLRAAYPDLARGQGASSFIPSVSTLPAPPEEGEQE